MYYGPYNNNDVEWDEDFAQKGGKSGKKFELGRVIERDKSY